MLGDGSAERPLDEADSSVDVGWWAAAGEGFDPFVHAGGDCGELRVPVQLSGCLFDRSVAQVFEAGGPVGSLADVQVVLGLPVVVAAESFGEGVGVGLAPYPPLGAGAGEIPPCQQE